NVSDPDFAVGDMKWIPTRDGTVCSRCPPGGALHPCRTNADCLVFGGDSATDNNSTSPARCAASWNGRTNAPPTPVCVLRCKTDDDCAAGAGGFCDNSNPHDPGICRAVKNGCVGSNCPEDPPSIELECRPIGCDQC